MLLDTIAILVIIILFLSAPLTTFIAFVVFLSYILSNSEAELIEQVKELKALVDSIKG